MVFDKARRKILINLIKDAGNKWQQSSKLNNNDYPATLAIPEEIAYVYRYRVLMYS